MQKFLQKLLIVSFVIGVSCLYGQVLPDSWTGDSDIDTYQEATTVHGGTYSVQVDVQSGVQGDCDLSNNTEITVIAGNSYTVKFWGNLSAHVAARIVLDWNGASTTYGSYLNPTSGWEQLEYSGTVPTGAIGVSVRIRFYDQANFVAPETQYIDDVEFESPTSTPLTVDNGDFESWPSVKPEPTNHVTSFTTGAIDGGSIELTWTGSIGTTLPDAYLILGTKESGTPASVTDGTPVSDDANWMDDNAAINVVHADGANSYTFTGLNGNTQYDFIIYPYTNIGGDIDYKTDVTVPTTSGMTLNGPDIFGYEDFETGDFGAMTPYSVSSTNAWEILNYGGAENSTYFARMNGYQQTETSNDWLISPSNDLDAYTDEVFSFYTQYNYGSDDATNYLKVLYSTDYSGSGDPTLAAWSELTFTKPAAVDTWTGSGDIDISGISGENVYFAFQYYSEDDPRRWDVDQIRLSGNEIQSSIGVEVTQTISKFQLHQNYPNPFNPTTRLTVDIAKANAQVELTVFNILGKKVATLYNGTAPQGQLVMEWNGRDFAGKLMPSGVYFATVKAGQFTQTIKMMLMK